MGDRLNTLARVLLKLTWLGIVLNEIRGAVVALPVIYVLYTSGGTLMAVWLAFCALAGIALSVIIPAYVLRWVQTRLETLVSTH